MPRWIFICGMPCVSKSTAIERAREHHGIAVDDQTYALPDGTMLQPTNHHAPGMRARWMLKKMTAMWKAFAQDLSGDATRIFDGSPLCALVHDKVQAMHSGEDYKTCLNCDVLAEMALQVFQPLAEVGLVVDLVFCSVEYPDSYAGAAARIREQNPAAKEYTAEYLEDLDCAYRNFAHVFRGTRRHANINVVVLENQVPDFFKFYPTICLGPQ